MKKLKSILINLALMIFIIIIIFGLCELIVRIKYQNRYVLFPRYHTDAHYGEFTLRRTRPNSKFWHKSPDGKWRFIINAQGFRSRKDYTYAKPDSTLRILCLGDSHTMGYEVRQDFTFSAIIEKYLHKQGVRAEALNTGVSGFSTAEELAFLENEGIRYQPDIVILAFFGNDFEDNIKADLFKLDKNGKLILNKTFHAPGIKIQNLMNSIPLLRWMSEHSYFYSMLLNNAWLFYKTRLTQKAKDRAVEYAIPTQEKASDYESELATALIKRMCHFCQKNNILFLILDLPEKMSKTEIQPSISQVFLKTLDSCYDDIVLSDSLLSKYYGVAEIHLSNGHWHISEFTHAMLGTAAAEKIMKIIDSDQYLLKK